MKAFQYLALLAALSCTAFTARAQPVHHLSQEAAWQLRVGEQLAHVLASPTADARAQGLAVVNRYAYLDVDLSPAVPALVSIYRNDPNDQARIAAAVALQAIGDENGMQQLRAAVGAQTSPRVQRASFAALLTHYGPSTFADDPAAIATAKELQKASEARSLYAVSLRGR